ncbi:MAG: hypothetical protein ACK5L4_03910, partial [Pseudanabaena sp.]
SCGKGPRGHHPFRGRRGCVIAHRAVIGRSALPRRSPGSVQGKLCSTRPLTLPSSGHPTAGHTGALRQGR